MTVDENQRELVLKREIPFRRELVWKAMTELREITAPSRLVFDHGDGERMWFETTVTLQETGSGTLITLRQLYPSMESRDEVVKKFGAIEGGEQHLAKLEVYVEANLISNRIL